MISIGIVFYKEKQEALDIFFSYLSKALDKSYEGNSNIVEIFFVQNFPDKRKEQYLLDVLNSFKISYKFLTVSLMQNPVNNIALARKRIVDLALADWVYFTDPDVYLGESVFVELTRDISACKEKRILGITGQIVQKSEVCHLNAFFRLIDLVGYKLNLSFQGSSKKLGSIIDHAPTAHVLLNRLVVMQLGSFSNDFAKCGEDLDLTHRATQRGFMIYFGNAKVVHMQNFGFAEAIKKFFQYGQAQAEVFIKNGNCTKRLYRLVPAAGALTLAVCIFVVNKIGIISVGFMFILTLLLKVELIITLFFALSYGAGTVSKFLIESCAFSISALFRKISQKGL